MTSWRSTRFAALLTVGVAAGAVTAIGQPVDPFQEAPGPASASTSVHASHPPAPTSTRPPEHVVIHRVIQRVIVPQAAAPSRPVEPAPAPAVVAPAPATDSVRQFAAARGIPLPGDVQIRRASAAPSPASRLVGVWGGQWGAKGRYIVLAVEAIDASGAPIVFYAHSGPTAFTWNQKPAGWGRHSAQLRGNVMEWTGRDGSHFRFSLVGDNQLFGELENGGRQNSSYFTRLQ